MVGPLVLAGLGGILMGLGYTTGAYTGYGFWNNPSVDPFQVHKGKSYKGQRMQLSEMAYGMSGYGRYRRRYSRFRRYRRYRRYPRFYRRYY